MKFKLKRLSVAVAAGLGSAVASAQYYGTYAPVVVREPGLWSNAWVQAIAGFGCGLIVGAFFSPKLAPFRRAVTLVAVAVVATALVWAAPAFGTVFSFTAGAVIAYRLLGLRASVDQRRKLTTFGSAEWATAEQIASAGLIGTDGIWLGYYRVGLRLLSLCYRGARHLLIVAPTTAGKGVSAIIPNLLTYEGSVVLIDPKGENSMICAARRGKGDPSRNIPGMGQEFHAVDAFGITGLPVSCYNPID